MGQGTSKGQFASDQEVFMPDLGGDSMGRGRANQRKNFNHPMAALFHLLFKSLALLFYLFGGLFGQDFISTFVAVILLISMDFWVVKNVTGRLLAGLRWSNYIDDEGNSHWIFENKNKPKNQEANEDEDEDDERDFFQGSENKQSNSTSTADTFVFWMGLIVAQSMWGLLMFVSLFRLNLHWFMLVSLASVLTFSNLYGYFRCRLGATDIKSSATQFVAKQLFLNYLTGGGSSSSSSSSKPTA